MVAPSDMMDGRVEATRIICILSPLVQGVRSEVRVGPGQGEFPEKSVGGWPKDGIMQS